MVVVPPATPPSTVGSPPSSPTSPADTSTQAFESDLEKGQDNEKSDRTHDKDGCLDKGTATQLPRNDPLPLIGFFNRQRRSSGHHPQPRFELG